MASAPLPPPLLLLLPAAALSPPPRAQRGWKTRRRMGRRRRRRCCHHWQRAPQCVAATPWRLGGTPTPTGWATTPPSAPKAAARPAQATAPRRWQRHAGARARCRREAAAARAGGAGGGDGGVSPSSLGGRRERGLQTPWQGRGGDGAPVGGRPRWFRRQQGWRVWAAVRKGGGVGGGKGGMACGGGGGRKAGRGRRDGGGRRGEGSSDGRQWCIKTRVSRS